MREIVSRDFKAAAVAANAASASDRLLAPVRAGLALPQAQGYPGSWLLAILADEAHGIDLLAVFQHFKMQMRAGRMAGGSHQRNILPLADHVALFHQQFFIVAIAGG